MVTNKTLIVAFFPKNVPAEICLHEIIKKQARLCSYECSMAPIATTRDISPQSPEQEIIILNGGQYLSVFRMAKETIELIKKRCFNKIIIVSCRHHAKRLERDLQRFFNGHINTYESIPQVRLRNFYLNNLNRKKAWLMLKCWLKEKIKELLPWPAYIFLASRS